MGYMLQERKMYCTIGSSILGDLLSLFLIATSRCGPFQKKKWAEENSRSGMAICCKW